MCLRGYDLRGLAISHLLLPPPREHAWEVGLQLPNVGGPPAQNRGRSVYHNQSQHESAAPPLAANALQGPNLAHYEVPRVLRGNAAPPLLWHRHTWLIWL